MRIDPLKIALSELQRVALLFPEETLDVRYRAAGDYAQISVQGTNLIFSNAICREELDCLSRDEIRALALSKLIETLAAFVNSHA